MPISWKKPPKKPQKARTRATLDSALEQALVKKVKADPEWALKAAKRKFGLELPEDTEDEFEKAERAMLAELMRDDPDFREQIKQRHLREAEEGPPVSIDERLDALALDAIESDPERLKEAIKGRVDGILQAPSATGAMGEFLDTFRQMQEVQEEMGGGKNGGLFSGDMLGQIIGLLPALLGKQAASPRVYVVPTADGVEEMDAEQYKLYLQRMEAEDAKKLEAGGSQEKGEEKELPEEPSDNIPVIRISEWVEYVDKPPQEFVVQLRTAADLDNVEAQTALALMSAYPVEQVLALLEKYEGQGGVQGAVKVLRENMQWLEEVIRIIQEEKSDGIPDTRRDSNPEREDSGAGGGGDEASGFRRG